MTSRLLILVSLAACGDNANKVNPDAEPAPNPHAVIVAGDFTPGSVGVMSRLDVETLAVDQQVSPNGSVGDDPMMRHVGNLLYIVNRADGNNVTIVDDHTFAVVEQLATGAGSNPQDVAVVGSKLYVPATGTAGVVVLTRGQVTPTTIDLSSLDPDDGLPDCVSAFAVDTDVYVACEMLDENFTARGPGKVVVIDSTTDTVRTMVTLSTANPFGVFERMPESVGGDLVIPTVPSFFDVSTGCVEAITPGATPEAKGCLVPNTDIGGFVSRIMYQNIGTDMMWMVVSSFDTEPHGNLQGYDLQTQCLWSAPITPDTQVLVDAVVCPDQQLVIADQTMAANGLRVYSGFAEITTAPLAIGLKPASAHGLACY